MRYHNSAGTPGVCVGGGGEACVRACVPACVREFGGGRGRDGRCMCSKATHALCCWRSSVLSPRSRLPPPSSPALDFPLLLAAGVHCGRPLPHVCSRGGAGPGAGHGGAGGRAALPHCSLRGDPAHARAVDKLQVRTYGGRWLLSTATPTQMCRWPCNLLSSASVCVVGCSINPTFPRKAAIRGLASQRRPEAMQMPRSSACVAVAAGPAPPCLGYVLWAL